MRSSPIPLLLVVVASNFMTSCRHSSQGAPEPAPSRGQPASSAAGAPLTANPPQATPRPTSKQGCDACGGQWAVHGIEQVEGCICRTKDGGKACRDGTECEGSCLVKDDAKFETVEPGPPPRGHYVGRCADYDTTFGCNRMIPNGVRAKGPLAVEEAAKTFCVD